MADEKFILAHDVGTSGNKGSIVSVNGKIMGTAREPYEVTFPQPGWAEQDPREWWEAVCKTSQEVIVSTGIDSHEIVGVSFTGQVPCCVPVDKEGNPLRNAISWFDTRSRDIARKTFGGAINISGYGLGRILKWLRITGGAPSLTGIDFPTQLLWIREAEPAIYERTHKFLTVKAFLLYQTTGKFTMTYDDGNLTWFMDTRRKKMCWSDSLLADLHVPKEKLPDLVKCTDIVGPLTSTACERMGLQEGTPVIGGAGDTLGCAVGSGAVREKEGHVCIGTSDWVTCHVDKRLVSPSTATGSICSAHPSKYITIAEQQTAGGSLEWAQKQLYHAQTLITEEGTQNVFEIFDKLVASCEPGAHGLHFLPWMYGERVPIDDAHVRGGWANLSLRHTREDIIRSIFEGVALNIRWALWAVESLIKKPFPYLKFGGGGAKSDPWCQILADVTQRPIWRVAEPQYVGSRGAALMAAFGLGYIKNFDDISDMVEIEKKFDPNSDLAGLYNKKFDEFKAYYASTKKWYRSLRNEK